MNNQLREAYVVSAMRTAVGKRNGVFGKQRPDDLLTALLKNLAKQVPKLDLAAIDDVIIGCAMPEAEQGFNVARTALLLAGYPVTVPGMTFNRFCASGLQSVALAAERIGLGHADVMIAGGVESMSLVPMMSNKPAFNPAIFDDDHIALAFGMGITAEKVAQKYGVSRQRQDEYSLLSHQRACDAIKRGKFVQEILPYSVTLNRFDWDHQNVVESKYIVDQDEGPRFDTSIEALQNLKPAFAKKGSVTAGNSSQMSDGAGLLLLASEKALKQFNLEPLARFVDYTVTGVPPEIMGVGPISAIPQLLKRQAMNLSQIEWIELNEAFAAQTIAVMDELSLSPEIVNPYGGAIALGHPLGATGAIRSATLVHGMKREKKHYGIVTMCIGAGMGAAGLFESIL